MAKEDIYTKKFAIPEEYHLHISYTDPTPENKKEKPQREFFVRVYRTFENEKNPHKINHSIIIGSINFIGDREMDVKSFLTKVNKGIEKIVKTEEDPAKA